MEFNSRLGKATLVIERCGQQVPGYPDTATGPRAVPQGRTDDGTTGGAPRGHRPRSREASVLTVPGSIGVDVSENRGLDAVILDQQRRLVFSPLHPLTPEKLRATRCRRSVPRCSRR